MESIFSASGVRASGVAGIVPDDERFGGFTIAKVLHTANEETVRAPALVFGTAHNKTAGGDKAATELFLLLRILHPPDLPDRPAAIGAWFIEPGQIMTYLKPVTPAFRQALHTPQRYMSDTIIIKGYVHPEWVAIREREEEHDRRVMAERFAAHVNAHDMMDRVYAVLHCADDTRWYARSPPWVMEKMREHGVVRPREKVTVERVEACLKRLVRAGRLEAVSERDGVFYRGW